MGIQLPPIIEDELFTARVGLLLPLYDGSAKDLMPMLLSLPLKERLAATKQLLIGLEHLTENQIYHDDITEDNILITRDPLSLHISDFGNLDPAHLFNPEEDPKAMFQALHKSLLEALWHRRDY